MDAATSYKHSGRGIFCARVFSDLPSSAARRRRFVPGIPMRQCLVKGTFLRRPRPIEPWRISLQVGLPENATNKIIPGPTCGNGGLSVLQVSSSIQISAYRRLSLVKSSARILVRHKAIVPKGITSHVLESC
jgi:hypothetical protein